MGIAEVFASQKEFFLTNKTKPLSFRIEQLTKIERILRENVELLNAAIYSDFGKSAFETYLTELSLVHHEISQLRKKLYKWSKPKRVRTGIANFPAKSFIVPEPLGTTLVIGAWNYPYQLSLLPAIVAIGAGNTVILKPSELPSNTSKVIAEIINRNFAPEFFHVVEGGIAETTQLLELPFDKIFFTGSTKVGRIVYQAAAKHLTPVTLELGGKSPVFVFADSNIKLAARRIAWGKILNAGQTCIAPDYVLVEKSIEDDFLAALKEEFENFVPDLSDISENYLRIINCTNFDRLVKMIDPSKIYFGGFTNREKLFIAPTILHQVTFEDEIMADEIFGPILPVISFTDVNDTIKAVKYRPKPLSCYIFTKNKKLANRLIHEISFGGGVINDTIMHISNPNLPFGGVGGSGLGAYHGKVGFDAFTHYKSMMKKPFWIDVPLRYPPYNNFKLKMVKRFVG